VRPLPPPPGEPPGRRGNGLSAGEWGALVDVDPRLSDQLLDRLAAAGVPAHVEPAGATTDPVSRAGHMPVRPLHRLWVDVGRADDARAVVEAEAAELRAALPDGQAGLETFLHAVPRGASGRVLKPPPRLTPAGDPAPPSAEAAPRADGAAGDRAGDQASDQASDQAGDQAGGGPDGPDQGASDPDTADSDAAWRAIVEGFGRSVETPVPPWPVEEDMPEESARRRRDDPPEAPPPRRRGPSVTRGDGGLPGWVEPAELADDGHYRPPPPPPTPAVKPRTVGAVAAMVLGFFVLFAPSQLGLGPEGQTYVLGIALMAGGAGLLVYWMRDAPGRDDGPDDGAVV
jgi:hypothetical protein